MNSKIIVSAISVILVVGVVIGVVTGVHKFGTGSGSDDAETLSPQMKSISSICAPTQNKELCIRSLSSVAPNGTSDPKELIKAAIVATLNEVQKNFHFTQALVVNASSAPAPYKMGVEDCRDLIQFAVDQLEATLSVVGDSDIHTINDRVADLQTWLSSVVSYQETCFDGLDDPALKSNVQGNMLDATQLTSNALTIVAGISNILSAFDLKLNVPNGNSRRLLAADGYPTWFSAADRKLLAKVDNGGIRPNAVVAKDGSGNFRSIQAALNAYPQNHRGRYVIYVKAGVYDEYITVTKDQPNVFLYGDGPRRTIITGHKSKVLSGYSTWQSSTFCNSCLRTRSFIPPR
ncbi:hypothetical protein MLD38_033454 [Melastoma candidum]|uniref:Uncharacterized protein n=1 Tax=Melastoma candidum TaxID=119954 RepID=A0ACB9M9G3_9MYRT|nr:hypothetical protein MLD38_033454 [Melastoma candidum]